MLQNSMFGLGVRRYGRVALWHAVSACVLGAASAGAQAVTATWTGAGGDGKYSNPANWTPAGVPLNGTPAGAQYDVSLPANAVVNVDIATPAAWSIHHFVSGAGSRLALRPGRALTVGGDADLGGSIDGSAGGSFVADSAGNLIVGAPTFSVGNGGSVAVRAAAYDMRPIRYGNFTTFSAAGAGSLLNMSSLQSLNFGWNDIDGTANATTVSASGGGVVDLSGVRTLATPARGEDRVDFVMSNGGTIKLTALEQISGAGGARFVAGVGGTYSLAALRSATNLTVDANANSTFTLPALTELGFSTVNLTTGQQFGTGPALTNVDNSRFLLAGGATWGHGQGRLAAAAYSLTGHRYGNFTVFGADGAGTALDLSGLQSLNFGWNDIDGTPNATTISAGNGGLVDLRGVTTLATPARGEDRVDFVVSNGGQIRLDNLQQISGGGGARFVMATGGSYTLPSLRTATNLVVDANANSTLGLPVVTELGYANVRLTTGQQLATGPALANIDNSRFFLTGGAKWGHGEGRLSAAAYLMTGYRYGNFTVFDADGAGTALDLSGLQSLNFGWNDVDGTPNATTVSAGNGGVVDLSGVRTLVTPGRGEDRVDVVVSNGGEVRLNALQQITGPGRAHFVVGGGQTQALPALVSAQGISADVAAGATLSAPVATTLSGSGWGVADLASLPGAAEGLNSTGAGMIRLAAGAAFRAAALTSLQWSNVQLNGAGATFDAPNLTRFTFGVLKLGANGTFASGRMTDVDNSMFHVSGGRVFGVSTGHVGATAYALTGFQYGNGTVFSADGAGSLLDLSSVQALNLGWQDGTGNVYATTVNAGNGGVVDLSAVRTLTTPARGEDRVDFVMTNGGTIKLGGLQQIAGGGRAHFAVPVAGTYALPALVTTQSMSVDVAANATFGVPALTTLSGSGWGVADLGSLTGAADGSNANGAGPIRIAAGAAFRAPALTSLQWANVQLNGAGAVFDAPNLERMNFGVLKLGPSGTFVTRPMTNVDNSMFHVTGGRTFGVSTGNVAAAAYALTGLQYGNGTVFSADGAGSVLDLSSVQALNLGWQDGTGNVYATTINAGNGGVVDLSGAQSLVTPARGEDRVDFVMAAGGRVRLDALRQITGVGRAQFAVGVGDTYALPSLLTAQSISVDVAANGTFNAPVATTLAGSGWGVADLGSLTGAADGSNANGAGPIRLAAGSAFHAPALTSLQRTHVLLNGAGAAFDAPGLERMNFSVLKLGAAGTFTSGAMTNVDNSMFHVTGGRAFGVSTGNVAAAAYALTGFQFGNGMVFSADGSGSVLDLSSVQALNLGWNDGTGNVYATTVNAANGGVVDLSAVRTLTTPGRGEDRVDFVVATGGTIKLDRLQSIVGGGRARFQIGTNGNIAVGDLAAPSLVDIVLGDVSSEFAARGNLFLANGASLTAAALARVEVGDSFLYATTNPNALDLDDSIVAMVGNGLQFLEAGSKDLGLLGSGSKNFGIGRLIVGEPGRPTTVDLIDVIDNGNRPAGGGREALYLYGLGGADGLVIAPGSTLVLDDLDAYAWMGGQWVRLNSMFAVGQTEVSFAGGTMVVPEPSGAALAIGALAALVTGRRRRRR